LFSPNGIKLKYTLKGHTARMNKLAWSPDGSLLASTSFDNTLKLWSADSGSLIKTLTGHVLPVYCVAWSPDGRLLASGSHDRTVRVWEVSSGNVVRLLEGHELGVYSLHWSPDGKTIASGDIVATIKVWDAESGNLIKTITDHEDDISSLEWSSNGKFVASGSDDRTVRIWEGTSFEPVRILRGHAAEVSSVTWSPDTRLLASASLDHTIRIWNPINGRTKFILEGHTGHVKWVSFSSDGTLLASKSIDGTIRLWDCDTWKTVGQIGVATSNRWEPTLAFSPTESLLATPGDVLEDIAVWEVDSEALLSAANPPDRPEDVRYRSAKVLMLGDWGAGKTGLANALTGRTFRHTETTHGRFVWLLEKSDVEVMPGIRERREIYLWDLAGQPDYRLIHQLYLSDVAVAIVVFDGYSSAEPLGAAYYWDKALRQSRREQVSASASLKKILVAAKVDIRGVGVDRVSIDRVIEELGFSAYFETSAKLNLEIAELYQAIKDSIAWDSLPSVVSDEIFYQVKEFMQKEKREGRQLSTEQDLYYQYLDTKRSLETQNITRAHFKSCINRLDSQGIIRCLSFGNLILLQPELLDAYASRLIIAAKNNGLGSIAENDARSGQFDMREEERIDDRQQESLLLLAMIEDLLRHEVAFRIYSDEGAQIVFPTQLTKEMPIKGQSVVYKFEGPVTNIYATLAVRIAQSGVFTKHDMWKSTIEYTTPEGGKYGIRVSEVFEGKGEISLFFDDAATDDTKQMFDEFVYAHLSRRALPNSIVRIRRYACPRCDTELTETQVEKRLERGFDTISCSVCGVNFSIIDTRPDRTVARDNAVAKMVRNANEKRDREAAEYTLEGKIKAGTYDVMLCHNSADKPKVKEIGQKLREEGILPWLDQLDLPPFVDWQKELEKVIATVKSAAIFVGPSGVGPWEQMEIRSLLMECVDRGVRMGLVYLPGCPVDTKVPSFLKIFNWVDFRQSDPDPMGQLIWGITGKAPHGGKGLLND
jgi:small GTP-binding protein